MNHSPLFTVMTWNVNSLRVRLLDVLRELEVWQPTVMALQETKLLDDQFPIDSIQDRGYHAIFTGQKAYNGVAILSRIPPMDVLTQMPGWIDPQQRFLAATMGAVRIYNVYVPNGESILSEKYQYKLAWLKTLIACLKKDLKRYTDLLVLGDFNIAPDAIDVHNPVLWQGRVLCSRLEREAFQRLLYLGLYDCLRWCWPRTPCFTWWDYRCNAFKSDRGLRIDHILASFPLVQRCQHCFVDKGLRALPRPSDHAPVIAQFKPQK